MSDISNLFENNRQWVDAVERENPGFFEALAGQQNPEYLWIGCADSRVPANEIIGLLPGEVFVHRNVANVVVHTDLNCLSVLQFGVEVLKVKHVIVVGHYGCGGVRGAYRGNRLGLIDNWLRHIQDVHKKHLALFESIRDESTAVDRLCELNVVEQVLNVCQTTVLQDAWERGDDVTVHGWVYGLNDGLVRDLVTPTSSADEVMPAITGAIEKIAANRVELAP